MPLSLAFASLLEKWIAMLTKLSVYPPHPALYFFWQYHQAINHLGLKTLQTPLPW